jgi:hypothetical protein
MVTFVRFWPLSWLAGPSFWKAMSPFTPGIFTFHNASRIASGSALPAMRMASTTVSTAS